MLIRCSWHQKYFGYFLIFGKKPPYNDKSITDGICKKCEKIFVEEIKRSKKKHR